MSRQIVYVRTEDASVWRQARERAAARSLSLSEVVAAGLRLWLARDAEFYGSRD